MEDRNVTEVIGGEGHKPSATVWCNAAGWWYRIDPGPRIGPFESAIAAGKAARAAIIALAGEPG